MKKQLRFVTLFLCLVLPLAAVAQEYHTRSAAPAIISYANDPNLSSLVVLACASHADCALFNPPCHAPIAVNTASLPALEAWKAATSFRFGCFVEKFSPYHAAACIGGYCAIRAWPASHATGADNNPKFCAADSDCVAAVSRCGRKIAVNTQHYFFKQAALDAEGDCETVMDDRPVASTQCTYSTCTVTLDNHPE